MKIFSKLARAMEKHNYHLSHPRLHTFILWVLTPKNHGNHYGFNIWLRYIRRD